MKLKLGYYVLGFFVLVWSLPATVLNKLKSVSKKEHRIQPIYLKEKLLQWLLLWTWCFEGSQEAFQLTEEWGMRGGCEVPVEPPSLQNYLVPIPAMIRWIKLRCAWARAPDSQSIWYIKQLLNMPPNKTQWHKELCKSWAASPKLCMTRWIIHKEEVEEEEDDSKYEEEEKGKKKRS